jgi:hypothetical protein
VPSTCVDDPTHSYDDQCAQVFTTWYQRCFVTVRNDPGTRFIVQQFGLQLTAFNMLCTAQLNAPPPPPPPTCSSYGSGVVALPTSPLDAQGYLPASTGPCFTIGTPQQVSFSSSDADCRSHCESFPDCQGYSLYGGYLCRVHTHDLTTTGSWTVEGSNPAGFDPHSAVWTPLRCVCTAAACADSGWSGWRCSAKGASNTGGGH